MMVYTTIKRIVSKEYWKTEEKKIKKKCSLYNFVEFAYVKLLEIFNYQFIVMLYAYLKI